MITTYPARHDDPDFVPSLRLLVERERYSLADIGTMFGVSRERVRQWIVRYGIVHPDGRAQRGMQCERRWNDALNCFVPIPRGVLARERQRARGDAYRRSLTVRRTTRWNRAVEALIAQRGRLGRADLSQREMVEAIFGRLSSADGQYAPWLQALGRPLPLAETVRRLRQEAGLVHRDTRGEHLRGRHKTHCRQGHSYSSENTYEWRGRRFCRACKNKRKSPPVPVPTPDGAA